MNDLYKVVHIEGKNLGCVALKDIKSGTLILQEKSQCVVKPGKYDTETLGPTRLKNLLDSFKQMVKSDQEEYLKLYNRFSVENGHKKEEQSHRKKWLQSCTDFDNEDIETFLKIDGIYVTNGFEMGVGIKAARYVKFDSLFRNMIIIIYFEILEIAPNSSPESPSLEKMCLTDFQG